MGKYEVPQATGASTQILYCKEADWGVSPTNGYRKLNVLAGETLDDAIQTYQSQVIPDIAPCGYIGSDPYAAP